MSLLKEKLMKKDRIGNFFNTFEYVFQQSVMPIHMVVDTCDKAKLSECNVKLLRKQMDPNVIDQLSYPPTEFFIPKNVPTKEL